MTRETVSIRELQQNLKRVMERVQGGQVVEVTRRRRPVARIVPVPQQGLRSPWPDLDARARAVFGDRVIMPSGSAVIFDDREAR
jgi:prevent-host-death family protein